MVRKDDDCAVRTATTEKLAKLHDVSQETSDASCSVGRPQPLWTGLMRSHSARTPGLRLHGVDCPRCLQGDRCVEIR